jgi:hypothetical protein
MPRRLNDFIQDFPQQTFFWSALMTNAQSNTNATPSAQKILAKDVHAKWDKISEQEASGMKSTSDLTNQVQAKYGLNAEQAKSQVDGWTNGRSF